MCVHKLCWLRFYCSGGGNQARTAALTVPQSEVACIDIFPAPLVSSGWQPEAECLEDFRRQLPTSELPTVVNLHACRVLINSRRQHRVGTAVFSLK